jgi:hypothetical protein
MNNGGFMAKYRFCYIAKNVHFSTGNWAFFPDFAPGLWVYRVCPRLFHLGPPQPHPFLRLHDYGTQSEIYVTVESN